LSTLNKGVSGIAKFLKSFFYLSGVVVKKWWKSGNVPTAGTIAGIHSTAIEGEHVSYFVQPV